jgi:hypothetical protein
VNIDVYTIMRNEGRMLPYFLRHYETLATRIFVWDDRSDDGTRELLLSHPLVKLLEFPAECPRGMQDPSWAKFLWPQYQQLSRGVADWVIIVDADELVYHPHMDEVLKEQKEKKMGIAVCKNYIMTSPTFPTTGGQIYEEVKYGLRDGRCDKWILFSPQIDVIFRVGRNMRPYKLRLRGLNIVGEVFKLLHFRDCGEDYLRERNVKNVVSLGVRKDYFERPVTLPNTRIRGDLYKWYEENRGRAELVV